MANRRGKGGIVTDVLSLGSKITTVSDCSHEFRLLLLGRKVMTNLYSVLKSRNITLPTNVCIVQAMVFPVVVYSCESWTVKKAEFWCLPTVFLENTPESLLDSKEIIPVNLKGVNAEYSLKGLMLKLKLQHFYHMMWTNDSLEKSLDAGKDQGQKKRVSEDEMPGWHHWCNEHELGKTPGAGEGQGGLACYSWWGCRGRHNWMTEQQQHKKLI